MALLSKSTEEAAYPLPPSLQLREAGRMLRHVALFVSLRMRARRAADAAHGGLARIYDRLPFLGKAVAERGGIGRRWIGVDLDGTLAHYDRWRGIGHIGEPVPAMLERVKVWVASGVEVRIFTARVCRADKRRAATRVIEDWCQKHGLPRLPVTNAKDFGMIELWDDRAVGVETNRGQRTVGSGPQDTYVSRAQAQQPTARPVYAAGQ
jgi:hypothetical protein